LRGEGRRRRSGRRSARCAGRCAGARGRWAGDEGESGRWGCLWYSGIALAEVGDEGLSRELRMTTVSLTLLRDSRQRVRRTRTVSLYSRFASSRAFLLSFSIILLGKTHLGSVRRRRPSKERRDVPPHVTDVASLCIPLLDPLETLLRGKTAPDVIKVADLASRGDLRVSSRQERFMKEEKTRTWMIVRSGSDQGVLESPKTG
jgi:hypothetical protein